MLRVMKEAGVLQGLTNALKLVDTDHPQVPSLLCSLGSSQVWQQKAHMHVPFQDKAIATLHIRTFLVPVGGAVGFKFWWIKIANNSLDTGQ